MPSCKNFGGGHGIFCQGRTVLSSASAEWQIRRSSCRMGQSPSDGRPRFVLVRFSPRQRVCFRWFHLRRFKRAAGAGLLCCLFLICASGCRFDRADPHPSIVFSKVPPADVGGPSKLDTIEGRARGARQGQQIVLYAKSEELWWVQPFSNRPFTQIDGGSAWKSQTHLGTEYAALLVDKDYNPPETAERLPDIGAGVAALAVTKGRGPAPPTIPTKLLQFSGYEWAARAAGSNRGGSHNSFDPANAWTDDKGALHLRISGSPTHWSSAEVRLTRSLGYGTYVFVVRDTSHLEPSAVLTLFTWDGNGTDQNRRELDVEISRWGYIDNDNIHYVVQPYYVPANQVRFRAPASALKHSLHWEPGQVTFSTTASSEGASESRLINSHTFTSGIPTAGGDSVRMNFYVFGKGEVPLRNQAEVVIEKFEYFP